MLLAEPGGTTHAETPDGDLCVDGTIAAYLTDGTLPPRNNHAERDKTCAPPPVPTPPSSSAATAADKGAARLGRLRSRLSPGPGQTDQPLARLGLPAVEIR